MNIMNNPLHAVSDPNRIVSNPDCIGNSKTNDCIICLTNTPECIKFKGSCKCSPLIHQVCLDKWLSTNPLMCPICKKKYTVIGSEPKQEQKQEQQNKQNDECGACCLCGFIMCGILCGILGNS